MGFVTAAKSNPKTTLVGIIAVLISAIGTANQYGLTHIDTVTIQNIQWALNLLLGGGLLMAKDSH